MSLLSGVKSSLNLNNRSESFKFDPTHSNSKKSNKIKKIQFSGDETRKNVKQEGGWQQISQKIACIGKIVFVGIVLFGLGAILVSCGGSAPFKTTSELNAPLPQASMLPSNSLSAFKYDKYNINKNYLDKEQLQRIEDFNRIEKNIPFYVTKEDPVYPIIKHTMHGLIELQKDLSESYYVFSHGMSQTQAKITRFIGDLDHRLWPNRDSKEFIFSRVVPPGKKGIPLKEIFSKLNSQDDHDLRSELLCADANLLNTENYESALDFYMMNANIFTDSTWIICDILRKFGQEFSMEFSEQNCRSKIIFKSELSSKIFKNDANNLGAILTYAIPKKIIDNAHTNFVYTSKRFGKPADKDDPLARLEKMIKRLNYGETFNNLGNSVRILTSHLKPENGIKSFMIGEVTGKNDFEELQNIQLLKIAQDFFQAIVNHCQTSKRQMNPFSQLSIKVNIQCERLVHELSSPVP